jgi:cytochrome c oxidase subunit IV
MSHEHDTIDPHEYLASDEMHGSEHEHHVHVTPFWTMFSVFLVLMFLTALTVWTANIYEIQIGNTVLQVGGTAHIIIALTIAAVKGLLVAAYFMHLAYDKPVNTIVAGSTIFGVVLFIGLTTMDLSVREITDPEEEGEIVAGGTNQPVLKSYEENRMKYEATLGGNPMPEAAEPDGVNEPESPDLTDPMSDSGP